MSEPATLTSIEAYLKMRMEEYIMNAGDTAFILLCAAFVFIMTPGLAFFYGGMVRRKNVGNTMMQCVFIMGVSVIMWVLVGYYLSEETTQGSLEEQNGLVLTESE